MKVKELKNAIYNTDDKKLLELIRKEFGGNGNIQEVKYKNNLNTLKQVDKLTIDAAIARMALMEEIYDNRSVFSLIAFIIVLITAYTDLLYIFKLPDIYISIGNLIILASAFYHLARAIGDGNKKKSTVIYFRKILESIKD